MGQSTATAISGASPSSAVMVIRSTGGWQPDCKIQRSGRNGQRDWCMSRVTAIISALVICIIVCLSWAVNHYRDNAITYKAQRDKNVREPKLANAVILRHVQMRQRCCCVERVPRILMDAKAENDACVTLPSLVVVGCTSKQSVSQCVKPIPPPAW